MSIDEVIKYVVHKLGASGIDHPVFYNFPVGIRFEIGTGEIFDNDRNPLPEYINQAVNRADQISHKIFPTKPDVLAFELFVESEKKANELVNGFLDKNYIFESETISQDVVEYCLDFQNISEFLHEFREKITQIAPHEIVVNKIEDDEDTLWHLFLYWDLSCCCIDLHNLFKEIVLADFGGVLHPLTSSIYLFAIEHPLLFHLYDDRGLDVIAADCVSLIPIYKEFDKWILNYDRERIDALFSSCEKKNALKDYMSR